MIRALLVDDEEPARKKLARLLQDREGFTAAGEAADGPSAVDAIVALRPDVVFLDIHMPGLDGFGVIEAIGVEHMPLVVFVTAFDEHAIKAFEVRAFDYVLKPVSPQRFATVLDRVEKELARGRDDSLTARLETMLADLAPKSRPLDRVLVTENERSFLLPLSEVDHIEAAGNYIRLHAGERSHLLRGALAAIASRLDPDQFLRISRSDIVRLGAVREVQPWSHGDARVILCDGTTLTWSRRYRARNKSSFTVG